MSLFGRFSLRVGTSLIFPDVVIILLKLFDPAAFAYDILVFSLFIFSIGPLGKLSIFSVISPKTSLNASALAFEAEILLHKETIIPLIPFKELEMLDLSSLFNLFLPSEIITLLFSKKKIFLG